MNSLNWSAEGTTITQEQLDEWVAARARPGKKQWVETSPDSRYGFVPLPEIKDKKEKRYGKVSGEPCPIRQITHGLCPSAKCAHTYSLECELAEGETCAEYCD